MAVIELGVITGDEQEPPSRGPGLPRGDLRVLVAALIGLACLLGVTASAPPSPHPIATLWSVPFDNEGNTFVLTADTVYVMRLSTGVTAYDLRSGAARWSLSTPSDESFWPGFVTSEALLFGFSAIDGQGNVVTSETSAVSAATGRTLWRRAGDVVSVFAGLAVIAERTAPGAGVSALRAIRLRDGVPVWEREPPATGWAEVSGGTGSDLLVTVGPTGRAELLAGADGRTLSTGAVPWTPRPVNGDNPTGYTGLRIAGNTLMVENYRDDHQRFTSYELPGLRKRWDRSIPSAGGSTDCGPVLCVLRSDGVEAFDEITGAPAWSLAGAMNAVTLDDAQLVVDYDTRHAVIDAATGRELLDTGRAAPVWNYQSWTVLPWFLSATREPAGLTAVAELDHGVLTLRGTIPAVQQDNCQARDDVLACPVAPDRLVVLDAHPAG